MSYHSIISHREMVFDDNRNTIYQAALKESVKPGDRVMDLGAGLGLHGYMASTLGASEVCLVDPSPVLFAAQKMLADNPVFRFCHNKIEEAEPGGKYDVIVSVLTGNFLLTEDLLPSLFYARDHYLKSGGILVPGSARMLVCPVTADKFFTDNIEQWDNSLYGLPAGQLRQYAENSIYFARFEQADAQPLCEPGCLMELDFYTATDTSCRETVTMTATETGPCHGVLGWFDAKLGNQSLSTGPMAAPTHWSHAFMPLPEPVAVNKGDTITFSLNRPEYGDWTWTVNIAKRQFRGSTFLGQVHTIDRMKRLGPTHVPELGLRGKALVYLLEQIQAGQTRKALTTSLRKQHPETFHSDAQAQAFVADIINRYC